MNVYSGMYRWTRTLAFLDENKFDISSAGIYVFTYLRTKQKSYLNKSEVALRIRYSVVLHDN